MQTTVQTLAAQVNALSTQEFVDLLKLVDKEVHLSVTHTEIGQAADEICVVGICANKEQAQTEAEEISIILDGDGKFTHSINFKNLNKEYFVENYADEDEDE